METNISFVIPVFRNEGSVRPTYVQITGMLAARFPSYSYQLIFVNDGSDDNSLQELLALRAEDAKVEIVSFSRNFGQVPAIIAGLREARGDATVVMSADLQDPVDLIRDMIVSWQEEAEIVVCHRISREDSLLANLSSKFFYRLISFSNPNMPKGGFDFVLLGKTPRHVMASMRERNRFFQGDILWLGFPIKFIPYHRNKRTIGKSQWTLFKKVKYFIDGFLSTSYLSIRLMSLLGVGIASAGFAYAILLTILKLAYDISPTGIAPIMILLLVLGGTTMLMLGIIGEYVWRIYDETRSRPLYIVEEKFGEPKSAAQPTSQMFQAVND
jgi:glycosyltransferase involved in cell wall biosynthesis